jgi:hypothetical protein
LFVFKSNVSNGIFIDAIALVLHLMVISFPSVIPHSIPPRILGFLFMVLPLISSIFFSPNSTDFIEPIVNNSFEIMDCNLFDGSK